MPPKRILRRPAAPKAGGARRRPAAAPAAPVDGRRVDDPPKKLCEMSLAELQRLGFVVIEAATYFGRSIKVAGQVRGATLEGSHLYLDLQVAGTTDEALLRAVGSGVDRSLKVHVCDDSCDQRTTGDRLVHALEVKQVPRDKEDWCTNVEEVVPPPQEVDELRALREAAREGAVEPTPKEKAKKRKKKDKKEKEVEEDKAPVEASKERRERGTMTLPGLFAGTGLDPDAKARTKVMKRARRLNKGFKKKKKKDSSASSSQSSSSSSSSSSFSQVGEGLFDSERKLSVMWKRYPGVLTSQAISEAKERLLTSAGTMWSQDKEKLAPVLTHYCRQVLIGNMSPGMAQEALTICSTLDLLLQARPAAAADVLSQRVKSLEAHSKGAHWSVGRQLELIKLEDSGIAESSESLDAARRAREEDKLRSLMSRPSSGQGQQGTSFGSGKGKKGKEKNSGKGKAEESQRQKGGDGGKKDDTSWRKK